MPVSDQTLRTTINEQAQKDLGLKINLEGVDGLTIQARTTAAIQSGSGPDIICQINRCRRNVCWNLAVARSPIT